MQCQSKKQNGTVFLTGSSNSKNQSGSSRTGLFDDIKKHTRGLWNLGQGIILLYHITTNTIVKNVTRLSNGDMK